MTEDRGGLSDLQHSCPVACPSSLLQTQHTAGSEGTRLLCGREEGNACVFVWMVVVRPRPPGLSLSDFFLKSYSSQASIRKSGNFPLHNPTLCVCVWMCVCVWVRVCMCVCVRTPEIANHLMLTNLHAIDQELSMYVPVNLHKVSCVVWNTSVL